MIRFDAGPPMADTVCLTRRTVATQTEPPSPGTAARTPEPVPRARARQHDFAVSSCPAREALVSSLRQPDGHAMRHVLRDYDLLRLWLGVSS